MSGTSPYAAFSITPTLVASGAILTSNLLGDVIGSMSPNTRPFRRLLASTKKTQGLPGLKIARTHASRVRLEILE